MNTRAMFAIVRKDLKVASQNRGMVIPTIIIILVIFVIAPWLAALVPLLENIWGALGVNIDELITRLPTTLQQELAGYNINQTITIFYLVYMLASVFLFVPIFASSLIAADSFAGEKERKTLEALLYTPTTDRELFIAKLLSGWLAAIAVALVGFVLYMFMVNAAAWPQIGRVFFPNTMWLVLIFWVVPALPGLVLGLMVLVSARAQGFQDAFQLGALVMLPMVLLLAGQWSGMLYFSVTFVFLLGLVIWVLVGMLIWIGSRTFRRGRLMGA